jgi:hypothetical protein
VTYFLSAESFNTISNTPHFVQSDILQTFPRQGSTGHSRSKENIKEGLYFKPLSAYTFRCSDKLWPISGKYSRTITHSLSAGDVVLTPKEVITYNIVSSFSTERSSDIYDPEFRAINNNAVTFPLNFTPCVPEAYATIFTMDELLAALYRCRNKSLAPMTSLTKCCHSFRIQSHLNGERGTGYLERSYRHPCS